MRTIRVLPIVLLLASAAFAQLPAREELTAEPRFAKDVPHEYRALTEEELKQQIRIVAGRSYAVFGYNTPEIQVKLPAVGNSSYATIDFSEPRLTDAKARRVKYELERGVYDEETFSDEIRFRNPNSESDKAIAFARAKGTVKIKYPLVVNTLKLTPAQPGPPELSLKIDGPFVSFSADAAALPESSGGSLRPIRAYDAEGRLLEAHGYSETSTDDEGVFRTSMAFYGNVARLELDSVESWAEFELPYSLPPAMLLPAGHEGENPASYNK